MMPIAEPYGIDDGYGVIGYGFTCGLCGHNTNFVIIEKGETVECENSECRATNICIETLDY